MTRRNKGSPRPEASTYSRAGSLPVRQNTWTGLALPPMMNTPPQFTDHREQETDSNHCQGRRRHCNRLPAQFTSLKLPVNNLISPRSSFNAATSFGLGEENHYCFHSRRICNRWTATLALLLALEHPPKFSAIATPARARRGLQRCNLFGKSHKCTPRQYLCLEFYLARLNCVLLSDRCTSVAANSGTHSLT